MMAMDENRDYGGAKQQGGTSKETPQQQVQDMGDLVKRDRNHPSVILWSFCNEVGAAWEGHGDTSTRSVSPIRKHSRRTSHPTPPHPRAAATTRRRRSRFAKSPTSLMARGP